ncbi:TM2 domain-containing protein [Sporolactobacillus pectinivorans]|uniref:TM2 domain-containing protein n=1 Tax=Sporolactobacillus pectinivorans TaxID=1591408 RepID=UPI001EFD3EC3|nr:TM2 domain-containing protein [Sporolactobacillus pectinivorans]
MIHLNLSNEEQLLVNSESEKRGKNIVVAYLLCIFLGDLGIHRFYLGRKGSAIAQLILTITVMGLIVSVVWKIVDLFLIPEIIHENNDQLEEQIVQEVISKRS